MTFHPTIMALLIGSGLTTAMLCYSAYEGVRIIQRWDISSGSEQQLKLERRTYLISTLMAYGMGFQLLSLFLFIYTADSLSPLFIGAMCAAGSLKVNGFGYPALILKIICCLLAGLWLIINFTDNRAHDYPLIRTKYWILLGIAPFMLAETIIQGLYLLSLKPNIITSCCGVLFSTDGNTILSGLLSMPLFLSETLFLLSGPVTMALGLRVYLKKGGATLFAVASLGHFAISIAALISFVSIYVYELPTHHCPFCILHQEYGYVGYLLYAVIIVSAISGMGAGVINPFKEIASLREVVIPVQRRLALISITATGINMLVTAIIVALSDLSMQAYV